MPKKVLANFKNKVQSEAVFHTKEGNFLNQQELVL
jgi:hypothetical protein